MPELYDLLVIGAGPAGCSTALHSAKKGLKTLLVEEHASAGEPVHCGECLSELAFNKFGLKPPQEAIAASVKGVRVIFPDRTARVLTEPGFVLNKDKFEQWLASQAADAGAQTLFSTRITEFRRAPSFWEVKSQGGETFHCKILADATGVQGIVSRTLGLNAPGETTVGMQYRMSGIPSEGYLDFYLWPRLAPHGYLWMIPKGDGKANVGLVTLDKPNAKKYLDEFLAVMGWAGNPVEKAFGGLIPSSGPLPKTFGDGVILVGDAAGFTSPLFEGGTHLSLKSGQFAAETAFQSVRRGDSSQNILQLYERLWNEEFPHYAHLIKGKNALYSFSEHDLNLIGRSFPMELSNISPFQKLLFVVKLIPHFGLFSKGLMPALGAFGYSKAVAYGW